VAEDMAVMLSVIKSGSMLLNDNLHVVTTARSLRARLHLSELQRRVKSIVSRNNFHKSKQRLGQRRTKELNKANKGSWREAAGQRQAAGIVLQ